MDYSSRQRKEFAVRLNTFLNRVKREDGVINDGGVIWAIVGVLAIIALLLYILSSL